MHYCIMQHNTSHLVEYAPYTSIIASMHFRFIYKKCNKFGLILIKQFGLILIKQFGLILIKQFGLMVIKQFGLILIK